MKLSDMRATLREIQVSPVKSLGQNFLHDRNLASWIVAKADLTPADYVVEIGPGLGALTEFELESEANVLAIEKDRRLAEFLRKRFPTDRLEVLHADALDFDLRRLFVWPRVKLLANLPYYVASQLLIRFTKYPSPISLWLFMLQEEMARRISAGPSTAAYGALTLTIQLHYRVEYLRTVPARLFLPQPEVDSAFVRISPRPAGDLPDHDPETLTQLIRKGFSQRRKQLRNLIGDSFADWSAAATATGFDPRARAEDLALEQWVVLSNFALTNPLLMRDSTSSERFPVVDEQDRIVGEASRAEVHGNKLGHRAVHILIFNNSGEIFLQKRSRWKDQHPGLWDSSAAGHVAVGEDYDQAAVRELTEELGITADLTLVAKLPASDKTGQEFVSLYQARHDGPFELARSEIEYGDFFPTDVVVGWLQARPTDFAPGFVECWRSYQDARPI